MYTKYETRNYYFILAMIERFETFMDIIAIQYYSLLSQSQNP